MGVTRQAVLTIRATDWSTSDWSDQVYEQADRMQLSIQATHHSSQCMPTEQM